MGSVPRPSEALPGSGRGRLLVLVFALLLELFVWASLEGYNLADTVEYVDLARSIFTRGELSPGLKSVRPPLFPLLLTPLFHLWKWLGLEDLRSLMTALRVLQVGLGLALVWAAMGLGTRLGDRRTGLVAGVLAASNPVFLRFSLDPVSDMTAAVLLAFGCERLLSGASRSRSFAGGLLVGTASIVSFKLMPVAAALFAVQLARGRRRESARWSGFAAAALVVLLVQLTLDRILYGAWGHSLLNYLVYNVSNVLVHLLAGAGLRDAAVWVYELANSYYGFEGQVDANRLTSRIAGHQPVTWYFTQALRFLVVPAALLGGLAAWRAIRRPRWAVWTLAFAVGAYVIVISGKHSKELRLWLPVVPLVAALCSTGWLVLEESHALATVRVRRAVGVLILFLASVLGVRGFLDQGPRTHGAAWQAVAWLERVAERDGVQRFGSGNPFTVLYRHSRNLRHVQFQTPLNRWPLGDADAPVHPAQLRELEAVDWLLLHESTLLERPSLARAVDASFELEAGFFERGHGQALGPLHVFHRTDAPARTLSRVWPSAPAAFDLVVGEAFDRDGETLSLLGVDAETLAGSGLLWTRWYWVTETGLAVNTRVRPRVTASDGTRLYAHAPGEGLGVLRTSTWSAGEVHEVGLLLRVTAADLAGGPLTLSAALEEIDERGRAKLTFHAAEGEEITVGPLRPDE